MWGGTRILIFVSLLLPQVLQAEETMPHLFTGFGSLITNHGKTTTSDAGGTSLMGQSYFELELTGRFGMDDWYLAPQFIFSPLAYHDQDDSVSKHVFAFSVAVEKWFELWTASLGAGMFLYSQSGTGGSAILNNGNSTSTFYHASNDSTSREYFVRFGGGYFLKSIVHIELQEWLTAPFGKRRTFNTLLSFSYGFF